MANIYWASPTGGASWAAAQSDTPLSGAACCTLYAACQNIQAGQTVYLRAGTYHFPIYPIYDGTLSNPIVFRNYNDESVTIHNTYTDGSMYFYYSIGLQGRKYIRILGSAASPIVLDAAVEVSTSLCLPLALMNGASYNEIGYVDMNGHKDSTVHWGYTNWPSAAGPVVHNWMHHCSIHDVGRMYWDGIEVAQYMGMNIGNGGNGYDVLSGHNTIEDCHFYHCGHNLLEFYTLYNVINRNYFHNEGFLVNDTGHDVPNYLPDTVPPAAAPNLWGHRNLQCANALGSQPAGQPSLTALYNLFEGNRFGHAGPPAENPGGENLTIGAPKNIYRFNDIFNATNNNVLFKQACGWDGPGDQADNNAFYNNTLYRSGRHDNHIGGGSWQGYQIFAPYGAGHTIYWRIGNNLINNIMNTTGGAVDTDMDPADNVLRNNFRSVDGDPMFKNPNVTDPFNRSLPDLSLQDGSPCIRAGGYLTLAVGAGAASTLLTVDLAMFFQDGSWGSDLARGVTLFPDWIAIGTTTNIVRVVSVNYDTNVITLASPMTWADRARVWLYRRGDGTRVLYGAAPEIGAHPWTGVPAPPDSSLTMANAAILTAASSPVLSASAPTNPVLVIADSAIGLFSDRVVLTPSTTSVDILLGPLGAESVLPRLNWPSGSAPEMPIGRTAYTDKVALADGSVRYNFRTYAPRNWTLTWERLTAAEVKSITDLAAFDEPLHYQNNWIDASWHWVIIASCEPTPAAGTFTMGGPFYKLVLVLEEVL